MAVGHISAETSDRKRGTVGSMDGYLFGSDLMCWSCTSIAKQSVLVLTMGEAYFLVASRSF